MKIEDAPIPKSAFPATESSADGDVVPIPTLPFESMMKAVLVETRVLVEIVKRGILPGFVEEAAMERRAHGEVVEIPVRPIESIVNFLVPAV